MSEPPEAASTPIYNAVKEYLNDVCFAGVQTSVINIDPDKLYIQANIFYNGAYSATIKSDVIASLTDYMKNISSAENFDGVVKVSAIEDVIQKVTGVRDLQITSVKLRRFYSDFTNAIEVVRAYETYSGYVIPEDSIGSTLAESLNFIIE